MNYLNLLSFKFLTGLILNSLLLFSLLKFSKITSRLHFKTKNVIIVMAINLLAYTLMTLFNSFKVSYIIMELVFILSMRYITKISFSTIITFLSSVLIIAINTNFVFSKIFSFNETITSIICNISILAFTLLTELLIYKLFKKYNENKLLEVAVKSKEKLITSVFSTSLIINSLVIAMLFETINSNNFYALSLDVYNFLSISITLFICYMEYSHQSIEYFKLCNKTVLTLCDDARAFRHDFHNIIQAIGGFVTLNDFEGMKSYYQQIYQDCKLSNCYTKLESKSLSNPAIYNILANKYSIADKNNIEINLDILCDLNKLNMGTYELTRIMGILLDNAIEASKECEKKSINITFKNDDQKQILLIENTYLDKQISIDKIFEKDYTTKPHNTGLGLWEVRRILSRNSNLNLYTTKNNDYFSQQLEIYTA